MNKTEISFDMNPDANGYGRLILNNNRYFGLPIEALIQIKDRFEYVERLDKDLSDLLQITSL